MQDRVFVAAAVQMSPAVPFDKDKTVDLICQAVAEAADNGAELVVFPECFVPMYPNWSIDLEEPNVWASNLNTSPRSPIRWTGSRHVPRSSKDAPGSPVEPNPSRAVGGSASGNGTKDRGG